jgi:hypothetical protein
VIKKETIEIVQDKLRKIEKKHSVKVLYAIVDFTPASIQS